MFHTISNEFLSVTVSEQGAELQSLLGADGTEYLWQGDPKYWSDRAINLFPCVAGLHKGKYRMDGQLYEIPIHGIAPYSRFKVAEKTSTSVTMELSSNKETYLQYPRQFKFQIAYSLSGNTLDITFHVENQDKKTMYFGLGGHPGINVPLKQEIDFEAYYLKFSAPCSPKKFGFTNNSLLDGSEAEFPLENEQTLHLKHHLFDTAIVLKDVAREVTLATKQDGHSVTVRYPDMPYLGIWHWPNTDAPYVCIEPWCSLPGVEGITPDFETKADLLRLAAGEQYNNHWSITIT